MHVLFREFFLSFVTSLVTVGYLFTLCCGMLFYVK